MQKKSLVFSESSWSLKNFSQRADFILRFLHYATGNIGHVLKPGTPKQSHAHKKGYIRTTETTNTELPKWLKRNKIIEGSKVGSLFRLLGGGGGGINVGAFYDVCKPPGFVIINSSSTRGSGYYEIQRFTAVQPSVKGLGETSA